MPSTAICMQDHAIDTRDYSRFRYISTQTHLRNHLVMLVSRGEYPALHLDVIHEKDNLLLEIERRIRLICVCVERFGPEMHDMITSLLGSMYVC